MKWLDVVDAMVAALEADGELTTALGGPHIYVAVAGRTIRVPSIEYTAVADTLEENTEPVLLQLDLYARGTEAVATIERRVRIVLHRDLPYMLGALAVWGRLQGARSLDFPSDGEVRYRSLDFEFETAREEA